MKRLLSLLLLLGLAVALLGYALSPQWRSFDQMGELRFSALKRLPPQIQVGVCWPFSVNQDGMADGLQLALEEINTQGLAFGVPMQLILRDDEFNWEKAKQIAIEFAGNPMISAVLGYYDDSTAIKASPVYEASRLLHLIVGANATAMTNRGFKYIVRTILPSDKIARSLAQMSALRGHRKVVLIWEEDAFGEDLAYQYRVALDALNLGVSLVYQWSYFRERADFRVPANEIKGLDADVVFFAGLEPWAGDFIRTARSVGVETEIVGAFSDTPEMRRRAGRALEGTLYFDEYNLTSPSPVNREFVDKFRKRYGRDPDTWAAQGYDALLILAKAVNATHSANPLDLSYSIRFMDQWEGTTGAYKFDASGELLDKPLFLNVYRNGSPVTIQESLPVKPAEVVVAGTRQDTARASAGEGGSGGTTRAVAKAVPAGAGGEAGI